MAGVDADGDEAGLFCPADDGGWYKTLAYRRKIKIRGPYRCLGSNRG